MNGVDDRERACLAPYAMASSATRGRRFAEPGHAYRGPFARDRDRILHCAAFRRLSAKTQVFTGETGDYHRTRLTHTLEVASIARTIGRALRLNEDLIEALALLHDIGHPPFGHAGEDTLDARLADVGGFNHNRHALRIVEELETRYREFPGLNLSGEVLAGQEARVTKDFSVARPLLEVQVVDAADSIAYDAHDADDALELGVLDLPEILVIPLWHEGVQRVKRKYAGLSTVLSTGGSAEETAELRRAVVHELIDWLVSDLLAQTAARLAGIESVEEVRQAPLLVQPSAELAGQKRQLEQFLHQRVYRHQRVMSKRRVAQGALAEMFDWYVARPEEMPASFYRRCETAGVPRSVGDYLAGMTDRFAWASFRRLARRGEDRPAEGELPLFEGVGGQGSAVSEDEC